MCDNEYLAQSLVRERLREAEARGALNSLLSRASVEPQQGRPNLVGECPMRTRLELWWQASAAWVAQLALPKTWNRL
jgi:hypothetical protein